MTDCLGSVTLDLGKEMTGDQPGSSSGEAEIVPSMKSKSAAMRNALRAITRAPESKQSVPERAEGRIEKRAATDQDIEARLTQLFQSELPPAPGDRQTAINRVIERLLIEPGWQAERDYLVCQGVERWLHILDEPDALVDRRRQIADHAADWTRQLEAHNQTHRERWAELAAHLDRHPQEAEAVQVQVGELERTHHRAVRGTEVFLELATLWALFPSHPTLGGAFTESGLETDTWPEPEDFTDEQCQSLRSQVRELVLTRLTT
jgi:hypothetical protein